MKTFLHIVAQDLLARFGTDLRRVTVVFPGKRASLFLNQELARLSETPVWTPRYLTIADLFMRLTPLRKSDPIDNVCTLYQIFLQVMGPEELETLDQFYGWGEIILQDFDDIDKHLADAKAIFTNIRDLEQIQNPDIFDSEQREVLSRFFSHFTTEDSEGIRQRFLSIWSHMYEMYTQLRQTLRARGLGYEGMIFREVAEQLRAHQSDQLEEFQTVVFAGFNVLNSVEEELLQALQKRGQALFYWDYDVYYTSRDSGNEAGDFMRLNLQHFPSALPEEEFDNLRNLRDVTFVSSSSDNVQARYVSEWFQSPHDPQDNRNAIVLCNEGLLQPVLHSLPTPENPNAPHSVNITMGFPLTEAPIYSFVNVLFNLQVEGYHETQNRFLASYRNAVLHHPYSQMVSPEECLVYHGASPQELLLYLQSMIQAVGKYYSTLSHPDVYEQLYIEAIFQTNLVVQQFIELTTRPENPLQVTTSTLRRLMKRLLATESIPFHGEPANGLQIMGVLETRCLDFSHLLLLSIEEKNLPKPTHQNSLIPANLRTAFHLTTAKHKIAVYAYYFYRLIQRTEHLTCVYSQNCVGTNHHEMSRFLHQLLAETDIPIRTLSIQNRPQLPTLNFRDAPKSDFVMDRLRQMYLQPDENGRQQNISPTAINTYMKCPMRFYFKYIAQLDVQDDPEDDINAPVMGRIFHFSAQLLYTYLMKRGNSDTIDQGTLSLVLQQARQSSSSLIDSCLDIASDLHFFHPAKDESVHLQLGMQMLQSGQIPHNEYTGQPIIIRDVLRQYLVKQLQYDLTITPFRILGLERYCTLELPIQTKWGEAKVRTGGTIDRLDIVDGTVRIVDYKTGSSDNFDKASWDAIFGTGEKHKDYYLQTFIYSLAEVKHPSCGENRATKPLLMYPAIVGTDKFTDTLKITVKGKSTDIQDFREIADQFQDGLCQILQRLFSTDEEPTFAQLGNKDMCSLCDFRQLCNR